MERSINRLSTKYDEQISCSSFRGVETVLGFIDKDNPKPKDADPKSLVDDSLLREID